MKKLKLMFASLLLMAGSITNSVSAATTVNIPTPGVIDLDAAVIERASGNGTSAKVKNEDGVKSFDNFKDHDKAIFTINNRSANDYIITFEAATAQKGNQVKFVLNDKNNVATLDTTLTIESKGWTGFESYTLNSATLPKGEYTLEIEFLNTGGNTSKYTVNVRNIKFEAYDSTTDPSLGQTIPGSIDLNNGTFNANSSNQKGKIQNVTAGDRTFPTLDNFRDGCSVSYDINATYNGYYVLSFAAACNYGGAPVSLDFTITDKKTGNIEANVNQPITNNKSWTDFSTTYSVNLKLTKGAKTLLITFKSIEKQYTTNVADLKFALESFPIKFPELGYATFSSTCPISLVDGVEAYIATSTSDNVVTLEKLKSGIIPANTGVVLKGSGSTKLPVAESEGEPVDNNRLVAVSSIQWVDGAGQYVLGVKDNDIAFYSVAGTAGALLSFGSAYLDLGTSSNAKVIKIVFDGETTGISNVNSAAPAMADNAYYTLTGMRVEKPVKGLYILNGKKVIVK